MKTPDPLIPASLVSQLLEFPSSPQTPFQARLPIPLPSTAELADVLDRLREILFPGLSASSRPAATELPAAFLEASLHDVAFRLRRQICLAQRYLHRHRSSSAECLECDQCAAQITQQLLAELPALRLTLLRDAEAALEGDPAARDLGEVILSYPGHYAITAQRLAHILWRCGAPLVPRMLTEEAHRRTGIDIHPGARIGQHFFIDHGTGVVIGETTIIGDRVRLYQGVTLGALSLSSDKVKALRAGPKRHPTLEDEVIVYAGATILGGNTVIGKGSILGGNSWVVESVPPHSRVAVQVATAVRQAHKGPGQAPQNSQSHILEGSTPEALDWNI